MIKKYRSLFVLLILAALLLSVSACSDTTDNSDASSGGTEIVLIPKVTGNAFFDEANNGAQDYASRNDFNVTYSGNSEAEVSHQIEIIKKAVEDKVDAICISSLNATALDDELKAAMSAGVKVVTWDSDVSGDARTVMVSQGTPDQLGTMLVEMAVKSLSARGANPSTDEVKYAWHYSQVSVADQNSWYAAGEAYIKANYPNWVNVAQDNYYSNQNPETAISVGEQILQEHPDIDLIICNDSTALPGQAQALQNGGLTAQDITVTGFASPNSMSEYCKAGIIERWGLWDCQIQASLACYLADYLAGGNEIKVGDRIDVPEIGVVEVMPNTVLDSGAYTASNSGVVLLPERSEFTAANVDDYDF